MAKLSRRIADRLERALGVVLFRGESRLAWPEKDFVERLFARLKPDCVIDVGANAGQYALSLRDAGFTGTIISFEPNPTVFKALVATAANDPDWHCHPIALGAAKARVDFNVMAHDVLSSFNTPNHNQDTGFIGGREVVETIAVDIDTLDALLPELRSRHGFANPFLKMDTQGHDLEVLRGGAEVARQFCGLVGEVSILPIYQQSPSIGDSLAAFRAAGFYAVELFNVHPENPPRQMVECDCYCVREDLV